MNPERAQLQDGKVFDIHDFAVDERYLSPDYKREDGECSLTPTGRLIVFRLIPNFDSRLPSFEARWDGGSRKQGREHLI